MRKKKRTVRKRRTTYTSRSVVVRARSSNHTFAALDKKMLSWFWKAGTLVHWSSRRRRNSLQKLSRRRQDADVAVISCPYLIARLLLATTLGGRHPTSSSRSESVVLKRSHASLANSKSVLFHCVPSLVEDDSSPPSMADRPPANHGILFSKSIAASLPATQHSRFSWFSCCFRVVHLVMQGKDAD